MEDAKYPSTNPWHIKGSFVVYLIISTIFGAIIGYGFYETGIKQSEVITLLIIALIGIFAVPSLPLSFCLFLFSLPVNKIWQIEVFLPLRLNYLFFGIFFLSIIYNCNSEEKRKKIIEKMQTAFDVPLFLFFCFIILSVLQTVHIPINPPLAYQTMIYYPWIKSLSKIALLGGCIIMFYMTQYVLSSREEIKEYMHKYAFFAAFFSVYGIIAFLVYLVFGFFISLDGYPAVIHLGNDTPRIISTEQEPIFFGWYLMTILPVLCAFFIVQRRNKESPQFFNMKLLQWLIIIIGGALIGTGSRSAIIGFLFSLGMLFFIYKGAQPYKQYCRDIFAVVGKNGANILNKILFFFSPDKTKAIKIICSAFLVGVILIGMYGASTWEETVVQVKGGIEDVLIGPIVGTWDASYGKYWSTRTRFIAYSYAVDAFKAHPWFGIGYENFGYHAGNKVYYGLMPDNIRWPEVNNYPLKILAEMGIVGFLLFLFLVGTFFFTLIKAMSKTKDLFLKTVLQGSLASFMGIAVILLFSSNITRPYLWVSLSMVIAAIKVAEKEVMD